MRSRMSESLLPSARQLSPIYPVPLPVLFTANAWAEFPSNVLAVVDAAHAPVILSPTEDVARSMSDRTLEWAGQLFPGRHDRVIAAPKLSRPRLNESMWSMLVPLLTPRDRAAPTSLVPRSIRSTAAAPFRAAPVILRIPFATLPVPRAKVEPAVQEFTLLPDRHPLSILL